MIVADKVTSSTFWSRKSRTLLYGHHLNQAMKQGLQQLLKRYYRRPLIL